MINSEKTKEKDVGRKDTSSPSKENVHMHTTRSSRSRGVSAGVYFHPHIWDFVKNYAEATGANISAIVNRALERFLCTRLEGEEAERLRLEAKRDQLIQEEKRLKQELNVILRSGTYLKKYAKSLLLGDTGEISKLRNRVGVYAHISPKELNIILRILKRRENIVKELLEIEDKLLPDETYPFLLTERGWKIADSIYSQHSRSSMTKPEENRRKKGKRSRRR